MIRLKEVTIDGSTYTMPEALCERCHHVWVLSTGRKPRYCPRCRSGQWNVGDGLIREEVKRRIFLWFSSLDIDILIEEADTEQVLERDHHRCIACGVEYVKYQPKGLYWEKSNLEVHHIDGNKLNNMGVNKVTLCMVCHGIVGDKTHKED